MDVPALRGGPRSPGEGGRGGRRASLRTTAFAVSAACPSSPQLDTRKSQNEAVCEGLRSRIQELWDRLQTPAEEREALAVVTAGSNAKVKKAVGNPKGAGSAVSTGFCVCSHVFPSLFREPVGKRAPHLLSFVSAS